MKPYEIPLEEGKIYHIYNRGNNGTNLFIEERNYAYFLEKYTLYLSPALDTFAYCLLKNHFHFLVRVKENLVENKKSLHQEGLHSAERVVSKHFSDMFNSYTKAINKAYNRTGSLFESPFKRLPVEDSAYFSRLVWYIHHNPQKHGFVKDFRDYPHSSYHSHISNKSTRLQREELLTWFGDTNEYKHFHQIQHHENEFDKYIIEFD